MIPAYPEESYAASYPGLVQIVLAVQRNFSYS